MEAVMGQKLVHTQNWLLQDMRMAPLGKIFFKVWVFWKGHKIWKNLCHTFDKNVMFCARNSVLVKKSTEIFQNKFGQVVLYKL